ncbi:hypothetical protein [Rhizobium leguminosarum]|uniref:hypothetical protein n=1 Tax=Rhizobium leguminosarum TaxID=384 RepID=UPI001F26E173|nr:hypothetical protein [Rhizobium leguminosarum]UIJ79147.1 hypothetical protein LZK78_20655 [Rhizobium leguminosarum]
MGEWTAEAEIAVGVCTRWAKSVKKQLPNMEILLFGSAIYKNGDQFDSQRSDLDLVAVFEPGIPLARRLSDLQTLQKHKAALETQIIPQLQRINCVEPGVSIVALTPFEVRANVHKSGARRFFDKNFFLNLLTGEERIALSDDAGTVTIPDENRYALEYVQKVRNDFLATAANGTGGIRDYAGADPMPKALLRFAAQVRTNPDNGEWYDTRLGMELLFSSLLDRRLESDEFRRLFDKVSVRRGGRGQLMPLSAADQLHLAEVLFDIASEVEVEEVILWELGVATKRDLPQADKLALRRAVAQLLPNASFIRPDESLQFRMRGPVSTFEVARRLEQQGALPEYLDVKEVRLFRDEELIFSREETPATLVDLMPKVLEAWKPDSALAGREIEISLSRYLESEDVLERLRYPQIEPGGPIFGTDFRPDFRLVRHSEDGIVETCIIEVKHFRTSLAGVMVSLQELLLSSDPAFLVVVGPQSKLDRVRNETQNLKRLGTNVEIIFIEI